MNNENLNDFYKQNRFNRKLRERIDSYEPELSDSLWDRIEHGLVKKESRSKRMVWMVYVMAGLLLLSGAGLYYLASENKKLADAVKTKEQLAPKGLNQDAPAFEYTMPETTIDVTPTPSVSMENPGTVSHTPPSSSSGVDYPVAEDGEENPGSQEAPQSSMIEPVSIDTEDASIATGPEETSGEVVNTPVASSIENQALRPFFYSPKPADTRFLKEDISTKGLVYPKIQPYIGLTSELGSTRQKLEGSHAYRFGYEHALLHKSVGLKFGMMLRNGFFFESGLSYSNSGSKLSYDLVERYKDPTVPIPHIGDSVIVGNRHAINEQRWIDVPVQVGYRFCLNSKWAILGQTGLTYSLINSFSGLEPNEGFGAMDEAGESVPQPFQNYWSMNVGLGFGYQFARNWSLDIQGNYRRGLTEMNRESRPNHPERTAEFLNAKVGISYIFR